MQIKAPLTKSSLSDTQMTVQALGPFVFCTNGYSLQFLYGTYDYHFFFYTRISCNPLMNYHETPDEETCRQEENEKEEEASELYITFDLKDLNTDIKTTYQNV